MSPAALYNAPTDGRAVTVNTNGLEAASTAVIKSTV